MTEKIAHISTKADWIKAEEIGEYRAESLDSEGFIHCSRLEQLLKVANVFYPKQADLVLIWMDPERLASELKWEESDGDVYPHLYGPVNLDAVATVLDFPPNSDGYFVRVPSPKD